MREQNRMRQKPMEQNSFFRLQENRTLKTLFFILFSGVVLSLLFIFRFYIWTFLFAVILYLALKPLHDRFLRKIKSRSLSASLIIVLLFLVILVPLFFILIALADQTYRFYLFVQEQINAGIIDQILESQWVNNTLAYLNIQQTELLERSVAIIRETALTAAKNVTALISMPLGFSVKFFFMLLMLFFLLKDGHNLGSSLYKILPFPDDIEKAVVDRLKDVITVLLTGNLLIMTLQGLMVGLGLFIGGFRSPLLWGTMAAILSLIPVVGTTLIWIPAVIFLLITKSYVLALFVGLWCLFWYLILENLVKPVVFGEKLNFHPVLFFFLLLGSIQAFNLAGIIIGPILLTLFYSMWEIYKLLDFYDMDNRSEQTSGEEDSE